MDRQGMTRSRINKERETDRWTATHLQALAPQSGHAGGRHQHHDPVVRQVGSVDEGDALLLGLRRLQQVPLGGGGGLVEVMTMVVVDVVES